MNAQSSTDLSLLTTNFSRRRLFGLGGAAAIGAGFLLAGCGSDQAASTATTGGTGSPTADTSASSGPTASTPAATDTAVTATVGTDASVASLVTGTPATTVFTAADFSPLGTCVLLPDLTQGPYPTITHIERRDITEGLGGHPLRIGIQVVDEACSPISDAVVEIWHCDVDGDYSAYTDGYTTDDAGPGTTFFRGSQTTNSDGIVEFVTSYPGWYTGRAVHIHSKVHIDTATVLTTQFFFDDSLNNEIFTEAAYVAHGSPDTTNETDSIAGGDPEAEGILMTVSDDAAISGSRALIVVGLDPTATSAGASGGGMGGGGAPGGTPPAGVANGAGGMQPPPSP